MINLAAALPVWKQSQNIIPDGTQDPQWFNDCGECCMGMALAAIRGMPINPGSIRANLGGTGRSGITNGTALVNAATFYHVKAHVEAAKGVDLRAWLINWCNQQKPSIVLGTWPTPGNVLHWMITTSASDKWYYINPWSGTHSWLNWADMQRFYGGEIVALDEPVAYLMAAQAEPY